MMPPVLPSRSPFFPHTRTSPLFCYPSLVTCTPTNSPPKTPTMASPLVTKRQPRSANSSVSSSAADLEVRVKEMSMPATTFRRPCSTAAKCALVPPISQNCSFRHHSSNVMRDHFTSKTTSRQSVIVITRRYMRNTVLSVCTIN
ncbi:hypothetical protein KP509_34G033100 [Ceratopteris richardii]|uniref:Uncharacterized protein n=1 Tax=Ceratopteris richardii TaxID=49495 RepID=A0A8T2QIN6_CERRI|nr:hypothetical protein KP509_34G033100 [Ceratopteris richardii]